MKSLGFWLGFPNRVLRTRFHPQRLGHFVPLSFLAYGDKIQATSFAGGRWLLKAGVSLKYFLNLDHLSAKYVPRVIVQYGP